MRIRKRKELIDRELQIYFNEEKLKIDRDLLELKMRGTEDIANYEHTYHSTMEERKIELAMLDARAELLENDVTIYKMLLEEKKQEVQRMQEIVISLANNNGVNIVK